MQEHRSGRRMGRNAADKWRENAQRRATSGDAAWRVGVRESARAGQAFHHQTGAAARDVSDDRRATMNFGDDAEIDGEGEMHSCAFLETEILGFDEDTIRTQVASTAQLAGTTWNGNINGSACAVTSVEASLHVSDPRIVGVVIAHATKTSQLDATEVTAIMP